MKKSGGLPKISEAFSPVARQSLQWLFSLAFLALCIVLLLRFSGSSVEDLKQSIQGFDRRWVILGFLATFLQNFVQIVRFWVMFDSDKVRLREAAYSFSLGQGMNNFLPARAGDLLKSVLIARTSRFSMSETFGVLIAEKVLDLFAIVLLILASGAVFLPGLVWMEHAPPSWVLIAVPVLLVALFAFARWAVRRGKDKISGWLSRFRAGLARLVSPKVTFLGIVASLLSWLAELAVIWSLCRGQGIHLSFQEAAFVLGVLNLFLLIPVSMANVGPFEASIVLALGQFGIPSVQALAVATVHHSIQLVSILLWSGIAWVIKATGFIKERSVRRSP